MGEEDMKESGFTERVDRPHPASDRGRMAMADVCPQPGASEAGFCVWKKKCGKPGLTESGDWPLRDEKARPKRAVVDLTFDEHILGERVAEESANN